MTLVSGDSKVRLSQDKECQKGRRCQGHALSPWVPCCLWAKLFHKPRTAKKGEDSPKPWGTPEHPKTLPLGAERGHFVLAVASLSERGFSRLGTSDAKLFALPQTGFHAAFEIRLFTACSSLTVS